MKARKLGLVKVNSFNLSGELPLTNDKIKCIHMRRIIKLRSLGLEEIRIVVERVRQEDHGRKRHHTPNPQFHQSWSH